MMFLICLVNGRLNVESELVWPDLPMPILLQCRLWDLRRLDFNNKAKRSEHNPQGLPERTVTEMRVREFGPVTLPAYAGATAGIRSMTDEFLFGQFVDDPDRLREILELLAERRVAEPASSEDATPFVISTVLLDGETVTKSVLNHAKRKEPEPSAATTRRSHQPVALYPSTREEKPKWLL